MVRKKLTLAEWKNSLPLLIQTISELEEQLLKPAKTLKKQLTKYESLTLKEKKQVRLKLTKLCTEMQKETWEKFLKRRRDTRFEKKSARKRLSLHTSTHDALIQYTNENKFTDPSQTVEFLLQYALKADNKVQDGIREVRPQDMDIVNRKPIDEQSK